MIDTKKIIVITVIGALLFIALERLGVYDKVARAI
jgi:hypothetical protein